MNSFLVGNNVSVVIPLVDLAGVTLVPTGLSYSVVDEDRNILVNATSLSVAGPPVSLTIIIPASANTLASGVGVGAREVLLNVTTTSGVFQITYTYLIKAESILIPVKNTFQTWQKAQVELVTMQNIVDFAGATRDVQEASMIASFYRLTRFAYAIEEDYYAMNNIGNFPGYPNAYFIAPAHWIVMTEAMLLLYPARFLRCLRRAQIFEANDIIATGTGRPEDRRNLGLLSESIGESHMMFRSGKPIKGVACEAAMRELTGYFHRSMTLART